MSLAGVLLPLEQAIATEGDGDGDVHFSSFSDTSSLLSSPLSRSPSPPPSILKQLFNSYPSPPPSQGESCGPPTPENTGEQNSSCTHGSDPPPAKRRRVSSSTTRSSGPRETRRLNLQQFSASNAEQQLQLERLIKGLKTKRKIVVIAGAGISVSAGIPDFRSSTGLFKSLKSQHNLKTSGKQLFDASVYRDASSTASFHEMVRSLSAMVKSVKPTPFHHLLARLAHEGRLLRLYTQNVDGIDTSLEPLATEVPLPRKGPWPKTIQVHGGLEHMTCTKCAHLSSFMPELFEGPVPPECTNCLQMDHVRTEVAGKRSHGVGKLRPRMVLYNEHNPDDEAIGAVTRADMRTRPDAVIVVGTSLKIPGVKRIVKEMCSIVRDRRDGLTVWINNDPEPSGKDFESAWDLIVKGSCDDVAKRANLRKWDDTDDDDDEEEIQEVTDSQVRESTERCQPSVVLNTPAKSLKLRNSILGLDDSSPLTPLGTPRLPLLSSTAATAEDSSSLVPGEFTFQVQLRPSSSTSSRNNRGSFGTIDSSSDTQTKEKKVKKAAGRKAKAKSDDNGASAKKKTTSLKLSSSTTTSLSTATARASKAAAPSRSVKRTSSGVVKQSKTGTTAKQSNARINDVFKTSKASSTITKNEAGATKGINESNLKIRLPNPLVSQVSMVPRKEPSTPKKQNQGGKKSHPSTPVRFPNLVKRELHPGVV